ncbi:unnamed protein product [Prunus armeniaca]
MRLRLWWHFTVISKKPRSRSRFRQVVSVETTVEDLAGCSKVLHNSNDSSSSIVEEDKDFAA